MATKSKKHKQTMTSRIFFFETNYFAFKKNRSGQFRDQDLWRPRRIGYLHTKCADYA